MLDFKIKSAQQLSTLIEDVRKLQKLRQQDMAEKLHTTQQSYARMELNIGSSRVETLLDILQLLDVELVLRPQQQSTAANQTAAQATDQATGKAPRKKLNVQLVLPPKQTRNTEAPRKRLEVELVLPPKQTRNTEASRKKIKW